LEQTQFEKLTITQPAIWARKGFHFMLAENLLLLSHQPTTGPYPVPNEF
jgi:hypothetical protein